MLLETTPVTPQQRKSVQKLLEFSLALRELYADITPTMLSVLTVLGQHDYLNSGVVAKKTGMSAGLASRLLTRTLNRFHDPESDALKGLGWVEDANEASDFRGSTYRLSDKGRKVLLALIEML